MRIGIISFEGDGWPAGIHYQLNLLQALGQYAPQVDVCLLSNWNPPEEVFQSNRSTVTRYCLPRHSNFLNQINRIIRRLSGQDILLRQALRAPPGSGVDLLFPGQFRVGRHIAILYWIPDFQHFRLPEMFSVIALRARNRDFMQGIRRATLVLLSSHDARKDFCEFAPKYSVKARVIHFVVSIPDDIYQIDLREILVQYKLPERFFYLPNQFWKHKNHILVLKALKLLKEREIRPFIVCTGVTHDHRHPSYFNKLTEMISLWGLCDQIAILGLIPQRHVHLLIRQSICVLNPSLFEGWSTTVEETKSIGKSVLLSDLPVHREQDPPEATYFNPYDGEDLANKLAALWIHLPPGPDLTLEEKANRELPIRMQNYAQSFVTIAQEAINLAKRR